MLSGAEKDCKGGRPGVSDQFLWEGEFRVLRQCFIYTLFNSLDHRVMRMIDSEMFINGQGLTNGPDHYNGNGLTSSEWKLDDENQLERGESVGLFRRFYRRLMKS